MRLKNLLAIDALTCALMGLTLTVWAGDLSSLLSLPRQLLFYAGCLLFPIAAFMAVLSRQAEPRQAGVRLVIAGNASWVAASLGVLGLTAPNALGVGFILAQALVVALLALGEHAVRNGGPAAVRP